MIVVTMIKLCMQQYSRQDKTSLAVNERVGPFDGEVRSPLVDAASDLVEPLPSRGGLVVVAGKGFPVDKGLEAVTRLAPIGVPLHVAPGSVQQFDAVKSRVCT